MRGEHGLATPVGLGLAGVLVVLALAGSVVARVAVDQRRAASAADLAALAGATALQHRGSPCAAAEEVASANGAVLTGCAAAGEEVAVEVAVTAAVLGRRIELRSRARGGPVGP